MSRPADDPGLDALLALDGEVFVVDPSAGHWVKFVVKKVEPSRARPHGIAYSLTPHAGDGERLVGFDNAHPVSDRRGPSRRSASARDHRHRGDVANSYEYRDAAALLSDFWAEVDATLRKRGVIQ